MSSPAEVEASALVAKISGNEPPRNTRQVAEDSSDHILANPPFLLS